ncbi:hypothetical protein MSG28_009853, partial [Choristoneura fumiferana]
MAESAAARRTVHSYRTRAPAAAGRRRDRAGAAQAPHHAQAPLARALEAVPRHIRASRMGLEVSSRHPYLFSCGEDRQVKCWDLEYNKVIRHYHGHLSAVYTLALHPTIDVLVSAGRDATARVGTCALRPTCTRSRDTPTPSPRSC